MSGWIAGVADALTLGRNCSTQHSPRSPPWATLQAIAVIVVVLTSAAVGFVAGVALMAAGEPIAPAAAPEPAPLPRWERSV